LGEPVPEAERNYKGGSISMRKAFRGWWRGVFVGLMATVLVAPALAVMSVISPTARAAPVVSSLVTSPLGKKYLEVDGKPFYSLAVQFRMDRYIWHTGGTVAGAASYFADAAAMGFNTIVVPLPWSVIEATQGSYDWSWLQAYVADGYANGLKVELMWYGSDVGGAALSDLVPSWILDDPSTYQPHIDSNGQVSYDASGDGIDGPETAMSYADPNLLTQEQDALTAVTNELASIDTHHTVIGLQLNNETQVNIPGTEEDRSYDAQTTAAFDTWESQTGDTSGLDFAEYQIAEYQNALAGTIKQSNYPVYTMMNYWVGQPTASPSEIAADAPNVDFTGDDVYSNQEANVEADLNPADNLLSTPENSPYSNASTLMLDNLASSGVQYDTYYLVWCQDDQPVSGALEDLNHNWQPNTVAISDTLLQLDKDNADLATHVPGYNIDYFHLQDTNATDSETNNLGGILPLSYSTSNSAQGLAILNTNDVLLMSTTGTSTFTITTPQNPTSATDGSFGTNQNWVSTGAASYTENGNGTITVTVASNQFVDLHFATPLTPTLPVASATTQGSGLNGPQAALGGPGYESGQSPTLPPYYTLSYPQPISASSVTIGADYAQGQGVTNYNVQVTTNGSTWTTVASSGPISYQTNGANVETNTVTFPTENGVIGLRLQIENANLQWGHYVLNEVEVASPSVSVTPSVTSGGPASGLLANGNPANGYESAQSPSFPQYLTLSYSAPVSLDGIGISSDYGQGQGITQFNVQVTTDGTDWTTVASDTYAYQTNSATIETPFVPFATQAEVSGIRIQVEAANLEWGHFVTDGMYVAGAP
jgi:hypothetical protein